MSSLWYEKYRPQHLSDYVYQTPAIRDVVNGFIREGEIPNLLLSGVQGTGKSTLARCLINELEIPDMDVKRINASNESGIDTIRNKIIGFVETLSLSGKMKVVVLEEADRLSDAAQKILRAVTEDHSDVARFIFTCNYVHKVIPALHSRFQHIHVDSFDENALLERVVYILESENIKVENIDFVLNHVNQYSPDLRKIINSIQQASKTGVLQDVSGVGGGSDVVDAWRLIWSDSPNRGALEELVGNVDNTNFDTMMRIVYENAEKMGDKADKIIVLAASYLDRATRVADVQLLMHAFIIQAFSDLL